MFSVVDYYWFYIILMVKVIAMIFMIFKDPGFIKIDKSDSLYKLSKQFDSYNICVLCVGERPPRAKHCQLCRRCVSKYDHHCPWINNCVGARNFGFFYLYLMLTLAYLLSNIILGGTQLNAFYNFTNLIYVSNESIYVLVYNEL